MKRYPATVLAEAFREKALREKWTLRYDQMVERLAAEGFFGGTMSVARFLNLLRTEERERIHYFPLHHSEPGCWPPQLHKFYNLNAVKQLIAEDAVKRLGGSVERGAA